LSAAMLSLLVLTACAQRGTNGNTCAVVGPPFDQREKNNMAIEDKFWGDPVEGCRLSLGPPDLKIKGGQPVDVTLTFRNDGTNAVGFTKGSIWLDYEFTLLYENRPAPLTRFGERMLNMPVAALTVAWIEPSERATSTSLVSRLYDMTEPGRYVLEASKRLMHRSEAGFITVVSNDITIVIED